MEPIGEPAALGSSDWPRAERVLGGGRARGTPRIVAVAALSGLAVALVAAASSGLLSRLRGDVPGISTGAVLAYLVAALLAATLLGLVVLVYASWVERAPRRQGPEPVPLEEEEPQRRLDRTALLLPLLFASVVCLGIVLGWLFGSEGVSEAPRRPPLPGPQSPPRAPAGRAGADWPVSWLAFAVLSGVGVAVVGTLLVRDASRRRRERKATAAEELAAAVDESLDELEREADPRRAVIAAYGRMERALSAHGAGRRPPETPLEYLGRALEAVHASRGSISRLTSLFQQAKFSRHAIDPGMKREAIAALGELRAELSDSEAAR